MKTELKIFLLACGLWFGGLWLGFSVGHGANKYELERCQESSAFYSSLLDSALADQSIQK